jgi:hypothetical protein
VLLFAKNLLFQLHLLNTPVFINNVINLFRPFLKEKLMQKVKTICRINKVLPACPLQNCRACSPTLQTVSGSNLAPCTSTCLRCSRYNLLICFGEGEEGRRIHVGSSSTVVMLPLQAIPTSPLFIV